MAGGVSVFSRDDHSVLVCGGIGPAAARRAAEAVIAIFQPEVVYSAGFAGALDARWKIGDMVSPARVINASDGSSVSLDGGAGVLVSFDQIASPEQKRKLHESYGAQAVDMEAASVARAAEARGVEFRSMKVISDEVGFEFPGTDRFVDSEGSFLEARFALFAVLRPWLWARVIQLARASHRASGVLCEELRKLEGGRVGSAGTVQSQARK